MEISLEKSNNIETNNLDIINLKNLRDQICEYYRLVENIEIFKILQKNNVKYTENNNGIFVKWQNYPRKLQMIEAFLTFIKNNNF